MAKKRRRKRGWLKGLLLFIFTPLIIWVFAFLIWLNWDGIVKLIGNESEKPKSPARAARKPDKTGSTSTEKLVDEDRKRLDDILKKRK
ncbi:MAG: hypothetical protein ACREQ7_16870 [Candidatus Binatia bacterium]